MLGLLEDGSSPQHYSDEGNCVGEYVGAFAQFFLEANRATKQDEFNID